MNSTHPEVRVRFAPSPTGWLHIGGVRTALFNYLFAKKNNGKFLLRIEDTDLDRSEDRYTQDILKSLEWLGLKHDESFFYQSQRLDHYRTLAQSLLEKGLAYRCYCTAEEVDAGREALQQQKKKPMYNRACRNLTSPPEGRTEYVIRAKFPIEGSTAFDDVIRGEISFPNADLDDFVIVRSNQMPTYNFVVVVDDAEMKISHVIRGDDHINNTPKQVFLYHALQDCGVSAPLPKFAHLPMILGADKKKLSKRNGETSTNAYRTEGYLPEALLNFLVRLGWSHGDQEVFTPQEMKDAFNLEKVQLAGAVFNPEKLQWIQGEHMKQADSKRLLSILKEDFSELMSPAALAQVESQLANSLVDHLKLKVKMVKDLAPQLEPLLTMGAVPVDSTHLKWNKDPEMKAKIKTAIQALMDRCGDEIKNSKAITLKECGYDHEKVNDLLRSVAESADVKLGPMTQPMRLFVTGQESSAIGLFDLLPLLPWTVLESRLRACVES